MRPIIYLLALLVLSTPAFAQRRCAERTGMVDGIAKQYSEYRDAIGVTDDGNVVEVYRAPDGSWTMILSLPNGMSCFIGSGEAWTRLPRIVAAGPES